MKKLILMSALLLALTGCVGMPMGDGYSNYESGYGGFGGMDGGGFGGMDGGGFGGFGDGGFGGGMVGFGGEGGGDD
ncbi:MAG: hypothetical protein HKM00_09720 [Gallionella sp.]|jgi:hypothetical protein|nr:hypothetical protein [Gallionella sp.]